MGCHCLLLTFLIMHQQHDTSVCVSRSVVSKSSRSHSVIPWSGIPWSIVVSDSATPWTVACQAPPSVGFSRQECWSGLPFPSLGDLPDPGIEPRSPHCGQTLYLLSHQGSTGSSTHGIVPARILEWVAIPFSRDLPNPGTEPRSSTLQTDSLPSGPPAKPRTFLI